MATSTRAQARVGGLPDRIRCEGDTSQRLLDTRPQAPRTNWAGERLSHKSENQPSRKPSMYQSKRENVPQGA